MMFNAVFLLVGIPLTLTYGFGPIGSPDERPSINHGLDQDWKSYMNVYNKSYQDSIEQNYRRYIWEDNLAIINRHNKEAALGKHTYAMGVNDFTDMTADEFSSRYLSSPRQVHTPLRYDAHDSNVDVMELFDEKDWRQYGAVTPVKDQGHCGSCWAFSTTGSIEGQNYIKHKKLVSLSEQMLIDCCKQGNHGCDGGLVEKSVPCVERLGGIDSEASYPYQAKEGTCRFKTSGIAAKVTGYKSGQGQGYLYSVLQEVGPASVYMYVTTKLQHYRSGVFSDPECKTHSTNHAVLAVGYGSGYWLIKNSWGASWGMQGYFKIQRSTSGHGMCMIGSAVNVPTVA